nr:MAG TPA: hypothetical protein [Bacteriophage sp.]
MILSHPTSYYNSIGVFNIWRFKISINECVQRA